MKTNKKLFVGIIAVLTIMVSTFAVTAFASWISSQKSENNTVTIGEPLTMSVENDSTTGATGIEAQDIASFAFTAKAPAATGYKVIISDIVFMQSDNATEITGTDLLVWKYTISGTDPTSASSSFAEGNLANITAATQTFTLKLLLDLPEDATSAHVKYFGAKLTFTLEVVAS